MVTKSTADRMRVPCLKYDLTLCFYGEQLKRICIAPQVESFMIQ